MDEIVEARAINRLQHITNTEVVRRLLIRYFLEKGFGNSFDRLMYPALIQDLPAVLPLLSPKIEIVPQALEIDPTLGKVVLGWNLFVLGTNRMYLGDTYHNDPAGLARQITQGIIAIPSNGHASARRQTTPRKIVSFIVRVLGDHEAGYVDLASPSQPVRKIGDPYPGRSALMGMPGQNMGRRPY